MSADTYLNLINDKRSNAKMRRVNNEMVIKALRRLEEDELTYDNDATYFDSDKESAQYSYQKRKQFSGLTGCIWRMLSGEYAKKEGTRWAETRHVMSKGFTVRMLVLRWENPDLDLFESSPYCYHAIVTNDFQIKAMEWLKVQDRKSVV